MSQIKLTDGFFKEKISRTIDRHLSIRNWLIGFYIVEYEQNGEDRAEYGTNFFEIVANKIDTKGFSGRNLKLFRQFYLFYPQIWQTVSAVLENSEIRQALSAKFDHHNIQKLNSKETIEAKSIIHFNYQIESEKLINNLSFSYFVELVKIKDPLKRVYYEIEAIKGVWSTRALMSMIGKLSYERSASAKNPKILSQQMSESSDTLTPDELIKTPFVFDFLNLPDSVLGSESELENALLSDLRSFILELGHGFCFEAQQNRIVIGGEYFFIDLVFYHRILKCHVIFELKLGEFNHTNAGQLNTYIQFYKTNMKQKDDNDPVGILLCTNQNEELVKYTLGMIH